MLFRSVERGEDIEQVLQALSVNLTKKMLNGPLRELNHPAATERGKARQAVCQLFLQSDASAEVWPPRSGH